MVFKNNIITEHNHIVPIDVIMNWKYSLVIDNTNILIYQFIYQIF